MKSDRLVWFITKLKCRLFNNHTWVHYDNVPVHPTKSSKKLFLAPTTRRCVVCHKVQHRAFYDNHRGLYNKPTEWKDEV